MPFPYLYRKISYGLIHDVTEVVCSGESVVLLAPRFGGKRFLIERLRESLKRENADRVVQARFLKENRVITEEGLQQLLRESLASAGLISEDEQEDTFVVLDRLWERSGNPLIMMASNVDAMPHHLARHFLEKLRPRVERRQILAILSGEYDFHDLVYGPNSEFNCSYHYFLQGFDKDVFGDFIFHYARTLHLVFKSHRKIVDHLWQLTGGNVYLLRLLLLTKIEELTSAHKLPEDTPLEPSDFPGLPHNKTLSASYWAHIFRRANRLIAREHRSWAALEKLIKGRHVLVGLTEEAPVPLEWSGMAVREGAHLRFASPLFAEYVFKHYTDTRFGDLYARHGMWDEAFARYSRLSPAERMRPLDTDDRSEVEKLISAFSSALYSVAAKGLEEVKQFFVRCCNALGFQEITFWQRENDWQQSATNGLLTVYNQYLIDAVLRTLPKNRSVPPGVLPLSDTWGRHAVAASLQSQHPDHLGAVIISDETVISRERRQLLETLLKRFVEAHSHAITVQRDQARLEFRSRQVEIINSIFAAMGTEVQDASHVINMAAIGLRNLGYQRALFCLVDPKVERIQGVLDHSNTPTVDVARMTDYPLANPQVDVQPYVVATRRQAIIEDASLHPLTNKNVVQQAGMKAMAIVPILNQYGEAIGTIHVERMDCTIPSGEEVQDLIDFGRSLAIAIDQSERVNLLQSALDKIPDPVLIVDSLEERVRYSNKPAGSLFRIKTGWHYRKEARSLQISTNDPIRRYLREALAESRVAHNVTGVGQESAYRGQVLCDFIKDWRGVTIGALMHITPLDYLNRVLKAFRTVAEANDLNSAMQAMLNAAQILGHKWGRLYLLDEDNPNLMVSKLCFGMESELSKRFNSGQIVLPRNDSTMMSWKSIDEERPIVFHWNPQLSIPHYQTKQGLEAVVISQPYEHALQDKQKGDFWIAFPLITPEKILGKVSLQCDPELRPEEYEMLKVLFEMLGGLWDAFLWRDRLANIREQLIREAAEKTMATIAHNIGSRLAPLDILWSRYKNLENGNKQLIALNTEFNAIIDQTLKMIGRTKELIYSPVLRPSMFNLDEMIRSAIETGMPPQSLIINSRKKPLRVKADKDLLSGALSELLQNSKEAIEMPDRLRLIVTLTSFRREARVWVKIEYNDNGPGIEDHLKARIFDDFYSRRPGRKTGSGLGLGYVRRIVEAHRGKIKEEGKYGSGAKFVIEIPQLN